MKYLKRILTAGLLSAGVMLTAAVHTAAYIDPSIVTYIISVVSGVVVAGGAGVAIYWKRIKLFFKKRKEKKNAASVSAAKAQAAPKASQAAAPQKQEPQNPAS